MVVRRMQIASALSMWRAATVQRLDGSRFGSPVLRRLASGQVLRGAPRGRSSMAPALADLARPIRFPQRSGGTTVIRTFPPVDSTAFARLVHTARRRDRVIVDTAAFGNASCEAVLALVASGASVEFMGEGGELDERLGVDLALALRTATPSDQRGRELRSVRVRRLAHDRLWGSSTDREISVVLASRRPADIASAIEQVRSQVGCAVQILVGLHGDAWPEDPSPITGLLPSGSSAHRFDARMSLGEVLTALGRQSEGELVTKWDDDDWYGCDHLADLIRAYEYSGADVVGKAAEFVYLEGSDLTIRRFAVGAESYSWTLAGGTLLTSRAWLDEIGQWPPVRAGVDRALLDATRRVGGTAYRTHGFQYVLRRRSDQPHTWAAGDDHFASTSSERRVGLDLAFADITSGP